MLLERTTCTPPAGADPLSVTVPVEDCEPPMTLVGFWVSVASETVAAGAGDRSNTITAGFASLIDTATNFVAEMT